MTAVPEVVPKRWMERAFFTGMAVVIAAAVLLGFAKTFYLRGYLPLPSGLSPLSSLLVVHGLVATLWIGMFLSQTYLVAIARTDVHRRLGVIGTAVAIAMVAIGTMVAVDGFRRGVGPLGLDPGVWFLGFTLPGILLFGCLVAVAVSVRHQPATHKRLMLLATFCLLGAAFGRIVAFNFDVTRAGFLIANIVPVDLFVVAAIVYDLSMLRRVHPASMWGGAAVVSFPILLVVADNSIGLGFAEVFR